MADPVFFYVLVRNDMDSMCPGRTDAQVSHATSDFHEIMYMYRFDLPVPKDGSSLQWEAEFAEWKENRRFGTTIVLSADYRTIKGVVDVAQRAGHLAGVTHDPEYVLKDGKTIHKIPVDTCGWMMGRKGELAPVLRQFPLLWAELLKQ